MFRIPTCVIACIAAAPVLAQQSIDRCAGLLDAQLIDRSNVSEARQISESAFQSFCSQEGSLSTAYENASFGLQGGLRRYGATLGISYDEASGSREEWFRNICDQGGSAFSEFMARDSVESSGAFVAQQYNACVETLVSAGQSFLTGELRETGVAERFVVLFRYEAGRDGPRTVALSGFSGDPIRCVGEVGQEEPIGPGAEISFSGERSITCELPEGQAAAGGTFRFTSPNGPTREVPYEYVSRDLIEEMEDRVAAEMRDEIRQIRALAGRAAPSGQVAMFAQETCPAGWSLHAELAEGRVMIGASGGIGAELGADMLTIPRNALPRVALRLPGPGAGLIPVPDDGEYAPAQIVASVGSGLIGTYRDSDHRTEFMGLGAALELPLPPGIALLPCIRD